MCVAKGQQGLLTHDPTSSCEFYRSLLLKGRLKKSDEIIGV